MNKRPLTIGIAAALAAGTAFSSVHAQDANEALRGIADDTSITLSGTVVEAREDEFDLLVGDETVTIEVEDEIRDGGAYTLLHGDRITATGRVDDDLFEGKELVASALHIDKLDTTFVIDEQYAGRFGMAMDSFDANYIDVSGTVTEVRDDEFRIHAGLGDFTVEIGELPSNPLDDEGYMKILPGDAVRVLGEIDSDWIEGREIVASSVSVVRVGTVVD